MTTLIHARGTVERAKNVSTTIFIHVGTSQADDSRVPSFGLTRKLRPSLLLLIYF